MKKQYIPVIVGVSQCTQSKDAVTILLRLKGFKIKKGNHKGLPLLIFKQTVRSLLLR